MTTGMNMTIYNIDNISQDGLEYSTSGSITNSHPVQVADGIKNASGKYASLDGSWSLGDNFKLAPRYPSKGQMGWWGDLLSGINGVFSSPQFIKINLAGSNLTKINVSFDDMRMEYGVDFDINIRFNGMLVGDSPYEIRGNSDIQFQQLINEINLYNEYEVIVYKWSHEGRQVKILEMLEADIKYFDFDDVISLDFLEEAIYSGKDLVSGNVSSNELMVYFYNTGDKFSFYNPDSEIAGVLKDNRLVEIELDRDGVSIPIGKFWTTEWDVSESNYTVKMVANDILRRMDEKLYKNVYTVDNTNAGEMIEALFNDFGLTNYNIDPIMYTYNINKGFMPLLSHRQALEYILSAFGGYTFVDRNGSVIVKQVASLIDNAVFKVDVTTDLAFSKEISNKRDVFDTFELVEHKIENNSTSTVAEIKQVEMVAGLTYSTDIIFSSLPVDNVNVFLENNLIGGTVTNLEVYSWGISVEIVSTSTGFLDVRVDGSIYNVVKVPIIGGNIGTRKYKLADNLLRQDRDTLNRLIDSFQGVYGFQALYIDTQYLVNDVENVSLLDNIRSYTLKNNANTARNFKVIRQEISYDGSLVTRIKGRAIE